MTAFLMAFCACSPCIASLPELDRLSVYFDALRERNLLLIAERYASHRLQDESLQIAEKAQLTVELSRTYSLHAAQTAEADEREAFWSRAEQALERMLVQPDDFPRRETVIFQRALLFADRAEWLRWQAELDPGNSTAREEAVAGLQKASDQLRAWSKDFIKQRAARKRPTFEQLKTGALTSGELNALGREGELQFVSLQLQVAELSTGAARVAAMTAANERLDLLKRSTAGSTWELDVELLRLRKLRLEGDSRTLKSVAQGMLERSPSVKARTAIVAEMVRDRLDQRAWAEAAKILKEQAGGQGDIPEELRALHVEAILGIWREAPDDRKAALWDSALDEQSRLFGPWAARTTSLLQRAENVSRYGETGAALVQRAIAAFRNGKQSESAALYAQAAAAARRDRHAEAADRLSFTGASIQVETEDFAGAIEACRSLIDSATDSALQAQASLLSAYCRGRLMEAAPSRQTEAAYATALETHLTRFSKDVTASDAAMMLGGLRRRQQRFVEAIQRYAQVSPDHARHGDALRLQVETFGDALRRISRERLESLDGKSAAEWATAAQQQIETAITAAGNAQNRLTADQARLLVDCAETLLNVESSDRTVIDDALRRVAESAQMVRREAERDGLPEPTDWIELERQALARQLVSFAKQKRFAEASKLLEDLPATEPQQMLNVISVLGASTDNLDRSQQLRLGQLQLAAIERLDASKIDLPPQSRRELQRGKAAALAMVGRPSDAVPIYQELLTEDGSDRQTLTALAQTLEEIDDHAGATRRWQQLQQLDRPGSDKWIATSYEVARSLLNERKTPEALKLIQTIRIVYPDIPPADRQRFEELLKTAKAADAM